MLYIARRYWAFLILLGLLACDPPRAVAERPLPESASTAPLASVPSIVDPVTDLAGLLGPNEEAELDRRVRAVRDETGVHIALLTVPALPTGVPIEDFSLHVAEQWQGGSERDDGVLVTLSLGDRRSRIEVGYGLEGYLTDAEAGTLLADAAPHLRANDTVGALGLIVQGIHDEVSSLEPGQPVPAWRHAMGAGAKWLPDQGYTSLAALVFGALITPWLVWGARGPGFPSVTRGRAVRYRWAIRALWVLFFGGLAGLFHVLGESSALAGFVVSGLVGSVVNLPLGFAPSAQNLRMALWTAGICLVGAVALFIFFIVTDDMFPEFALVMYGPLSLGMVGGACLADGGGGGGGSGSQRSSGTGGHGGSTGSGSGGSGGGSGGGGDWGGGGGSFGGGGASGSW